MPDIDEINEEILKYKNAGNSVKGISDGYHTFEELYDMRNHLFIALCNAYPKISWKSKHHFDEENDPMYEEDFIAGINTDKGPITFHLKLEYWNLLRVTELSRAPKYDGYSEEDVKDRLRSL